MIASVKLIARRLAGHEAGRNYKSYSWSFVERIECFGRGSRTHRKVRSDKGMSMPRACRNVVLAACTAVALIGSPIVPALGASQLEQAELADLPELQAQVQARAVNGNSVTEVLLLNNIKIKHQASQIVAIDWAKGVAVVPLPGSGIEVVNFDPKTLQIKG